MEFSSGRSELEGAPVAGLPRRKRNPRAVRARSQAWARAKKVAMEVEVGTRAEAWAKAWTVAWVKAIWPKQWNQMEEDGLTGTPTAEAQWKSLARRETQVETDALTLAEAWAWAWGESRTRGERPLSVMASSSTICRILSDHHSSGFARALWDRSPETRDEYSCIIHFIAPITHLPFELLRQVFLIIIDETSYPPLELILVCKQWHTIVTTIWASLNLGTSTSIDAVAKKLERNQWLLDIVVDTDSDRGGLTPSDGAFKAIFAAIEASARWRSLVVKSFPAQADLPEDLVNCHL